MRKDDLNKDSDKNKTDKNGKLSKDKTKEDILNGKSEMDEMEMMKLLGLPISGFDSSKGKPGDDASKMSGARIKSRRQYRQYMNRRGGFNRPLSKSY